MRPTTALRRAWWMLLPAALLALLWATAGATAASAGGPLQTAIVDPYVFASPDAAAGLAHAKAAGATAIKVPLFWDTIAPATRPKNFNASNPSDPAYNWGALDAQLGLIRSHGLEPIVYIAGPPAWALRTVYGFRRTDPAQYQAFALAAARRYSGTSHGLPRVRYWQAWNEPNKVPGPAAKPGVAAWYRAIVNGFASSVHTIPGNLVIAGGVSPFGISTADAPLTFMRDVLCVSTGKVPRATCSGALHFDVWSVDPYTAGGPFHKTARANDISVAELPKVKQILDAAVKLRHVSSKGGPVRFWVTEFSWDSNPPDPKGVPVALEGRWVSEALHQMWTSGVSLVTWFFLRDQPLKTSAYQSGLYYEGSTIARDRPKPAFTAFRFPFVAYRKGKSVSVWGRTPPGEAGTVSVEQRKGSAWSVVGKLRANRYGIFSAAIRSSGSGPLRAFLPAKKDASLPFSLVAPPDRTFKPFGAAGLPGSPPTPSSEAVNQYIETVPSAGGASSPGSPLDASRIALFAALIVGSAFALVAAARRRSGQGQARGGLRPGHR